MESDRLRRQVDAAEQQEWRAVTDAETKQYLRGGAEESATDPHRKRAVAKRQLTATQNQLEVQLEPVERRRKELEEAEQCRELLNAARRAVAEQDDALDDPGPLPDEPLRWADGQWQAVVESVDYLIMRMRSIETQGGAEAGPREAGSDDPARGLS